MDAQPALRTAPLLVLLSIVFTSGCRLPWRPAPFSQRAMETGDPDFEGLLEAERSSAAGYADEFDLSESRRLNRRPGASRSASFSDDFEADLAAAEGQLTDEQAGLLRKQMELVEQIRREATRSEDDGPQSFRFSDNDDNSDGTARDGQSIADNAAPNRTSPDVARPDVSGRAIRSSKDALAQIGAAQAEAATVPPGTQFASTREIELGQVDPGVSHASHVSNQGLLNDAVSVREVGFPADAQDQQVTGTSGRPNDARPWKDVVQDALLQLDSQLANSPSPEHRIELEKARRLLSLSVNDLPSAMEVIPGVDKNLQDYYRHTIQGWRDATDPSGHPDLRKRATLALASQRRATQMLAAASDLSVRNASFCTAVNSFGDVERFESYDFSAGDEVLMYCEVDNFTSAALPNGKEHETNLRGTYKIVDSTGRPVDEQSLPANREVSESIRRDYFMVYRIWLPQSLAPGSYELVLAIEDLHGRKFGTESIEFKVIQ